MTRLKYLAAPASLDCGTLAWSAKPTSDSAEAQRQAFSFHHRSPPACPPCCPPSSRQREPERAAQGGGGFAWQLQKRGLSGHVSGALLLLLNQEHVWHHVAHSGRPRCSCDKLAPSTSGVAAANGATAGAAATARRSVFARRCASAAARCAARCAACSAAPRASAPPAPPAPPTPPAPPAGIGAPPPTACDEPAWEYG